jgi:hypothetical protein
VQIIPTMEWLKQINHSLEYRWPPNPVRETLSFFSRDMLADPNSAGLPIPESAAYVAPIAVLLASLAMFKRHRQHSLFFLLLLLVSFSVIQGWQPVQWLVDRTPVLAGIRNTRLLLVADFSLAVLAGLGASAIGELQLKQSASRRSLWIALGATLVVSAVGIRLLALATHSRAGWLRGPASSAVFLALGFIVIAARLKELITPRMFAVLMLLVVSVDVVTFRSGILPFVSRTDIFPQVPVFKFLQEHADPARYRVAEVGATYFTNAEMVYGLAGLDGYDLELRRTGNLLGDLAPPTTGVNIDAERIVKTDDRRLDLMNVRYLVATTYNDSYDILATRPDRFKLAFEDRGTRILENLRVLPRARFVPALPGSLEVIADESDQLARLKSPTFDPEKSAVLSEALPGMQSSAAGSPAPAGSNSVSVISAGNNESVFEAVTSQPGLLIVSQIFYPGWIAMVDGEEKSVVRTDYTLTGIPLKEGTHTVRLLFRPRSFQIGLAFSAASCLAIAGLLLFKKHSRGTLGLT